MCRHYDDYDCSSCCREAGREDALDGVASNPLYKNVAQVVEYEEGYKSVSIASDRDGLYEEERYPEGWAKEDGVGCAS